MTETPPTKPPLPPLRERRKLPDNCVDVTDRHVGERLVISATATAQCDEGEDDPLLEWMRSAGVPLPLPISRPHPRFRETTVPR